MPTQIDPMLFPVVVETMTATEIRARAAGFEASDVDDWLGITIRKICETPIQFRFPRSKRRRIRKKWRKDPRNFKKLLDDQFEDIRIVGMEN